MLNANEELSTMEPDELLQLCRQRLDMFRYAPMRRRTPPRSAQDRERRQQHQDRLTEALTRECPA